METVLAILVKMLHEHNQRVVALNLFPAASLLYGHR